MTRRGFSITELLVVIGIIVLLIGILLPALGKVIDKAKVTQTQTTLQEFAKACDAFQQEFGTYPGIVPEQTLALDPKISGTENALLHLMGGAIDQNDPDYNSSTYSSWTELTFGTGANSFKIKVEPLEIGKGPRVAGKQYRPFFAPRQNEVAPTQGQVAGLDGQGQPILELPDLLDAWGQPVIYLRSIREVGPLVGDPTSSQYALGPTAPYVFSTGLGELGKDESNNSILVLAPDQAAALAQIIRNPAFGTGSAPLTGTAHGRYAILSAGRDGIYFSKDDGIGTPASPKVDIVTAGQNPGGPSSIKTYDDVRVFGGG